MAKRKPKQIETLDDKTTEIKTTSDGWDKDYVESAPVLVEGWGSTPHISIGNGLLVPLAEKYPELIKGEMDGTPVLDRVKLNQMLYDGICNDLGIEKIKIAGNRASLSAKDSALLKLFKDSPEMQEALKISDPELYEKFGFGEVEEETETDESEPEETDEEEESEEEETEDEESEDEKIAD